MMRTEEKGRRIAVLMRTLKAVAKIQDKAFDEGDMFFALAFRSDEELACIERLVYGGV